MPAIAIVLARLRFRLITRYSPMVIDSAASGFPWYGLPPVFDIAGRHIRIEEISIHQHSPKKLQIDTDTLNDCLCKGLTQTQYCGLTQTNEPPVNPGRLTDCDKICLIRVSRVIQFWT